MHARSLHGCDSVRYPRKQDHHHSKARGIRGNKPIQTCCTGTLAPSVSLADSQYLAVRVWVATADPQHSLQEVLMAKDVPVRCLFVQAVKVPDSSPSCSGIMSTN